LKYNKSRIFKRAWKYKKSKNVGMNYALKRSWRIEKNTRKGTDLKDYKNMIRKVSFYFSNKYKVEYEDVEAQAYLIFCETLEKYDNTKSSFSTYLYTRLNGYLNLYLKKNINNDYEYIDEGKDKIFDKFCKILEFYDQINTELSEDVKKVLDYILNNQRRKKASKYSTINYFTEKYNWTQSRVIRAWEKIKIWWSENRKEYCYDF